MIEKIRSFFPHLSAKERLALKLHSAAGTYYTLFILAPLLASILLIGGMLVGGESLREIVFSYIQARFGSDSLAFFDTIANSINFKLSLISLIVALVASIYGSARFMTFMRASLHAIFTGSKTDTLAIEQPVSRMTIVSFLYFSLIVLIGSLLIVFQVVMSVIATSVFAEFSTFLFSSEFMFVINAIMNILSLSVIIGLLYLIVLPRIGWRKAYLGACTASVLITVLNVVLSLYVAVSGSHDIYGAYGFIIVLFIWLYYSLYSVFYGAYAVRNRL